MAPVFTRARDSIPGTAPQTAAYVLYSTDKTDLGSIKLQGTEWVLEHIGTELGLGLGVLGLRVRT